MTQSIGITLMNVGSAMIGAGIIVMVLCIAAWVFIQMFDKL